jgi:lysophospholipase L1-like esterase
MKNRTKLETQFFQKSTFIIMKKLTLFPLFVLITLSLYAQNAPYPFTAEIEKFEQIDSTINIEKGQIMLYGSSTIRFWKGCEQDFAFKNLKVVNRGFGGSQAHQAIYFFDRVVMPHRPSWLFFYEGDNDINAGKSVIETFQDYQIIINMVKKQLPNTRLVLFSIKYSPSRMQFYDKQKEFNQLLKDYCQALKNVYFLDVATPMLDGENKPTPSYFVQDMLHMNRSGYALWTDIVRQFLKTQKML